MSRAKLLQFSFQIPLTHLKKENSLFSAVQVGEITIFGKARILKEPQDLPEALQEDHWADITLSGVFYKDIDILPVFSSLKECRPMMISLMAAASSQCLSIYQEKYQ